MQATIVWPRKLPFPREIRATTKYLDPWVCRLYVHYRPNEGLYYYSSRPTSQNNPNIESINTILITRIWTLVGGWEFLTFKTRIPSGPVTSVVI